VFDSVICDTGDLKNCTGGLSSLVRSVDGWVQRDTSCAVLSLAHHQCRINWESSRVANATASP